MSQARDDAQHNLGRERIRLINDCLLELYHVRAKCERAQALDGTVPTQHRLALHTAIRDTYLALRPLRDETTIDDWWQTVELSSYWGEWIEATPDEDNAVPVAKTQDGKRIHARWQPYTGLETLQQITDIVEETTRTTHVFGGTKTETVKQPNPLKYRILLDISTTLEDAADRLGFAPRVDQTAARPEDNPVDPGGRFDE